MYEISQVRRCVTLQRVQSTNTNLQIRVDTLFIFFLYKKITPPVMMVCVCTTHT